MKLKSWNGNAINDGTDYAAHWADHAPHGLPAVGAVGSGRTGNWPILAKIDRSGRILRFKVYVRPGGSGSSDELDGWFDPDDETAKQLTVEDAGGGNDRYVMAICEQFEEVPYTAGRVYQAQVRVHGDVKFREVTPSTDSEAVTSSGQTWNVTNNGKADAYPTVLITPITSKSGGFTKKRPVFIKWRSLFAAPRYPTDLTDNSFDTAAEISGGDMQADGDDLRPYVNGSEVERWLDGINTTTTKVWVNLDYQPGITGILRTAIASSGSIASIDFNLTAMTLGVFADLPPAGTVMIDSEVFTYTGKDNQTRQLTGITRAAKGTSMAAHTVGDGVFWIQHDIVIFYGDATLSAPTVDDINKPIFNLATSTNTSWDYDDFGEEDGLRTGAWRFNNVTNSSRRYTANQDTDADPWSEIGIANNILGGSLSWARWEIYNPCYITVANFQNGHKRSESNLSAWSATIQSRSAGGGYTGEDTIAAPSTLATWEAWSDNETITAGAVTVILQLQRAAGVPGIDDQFLEVADVTLTLNGSFTPAITIGAEESVYPLSCRITNNTTGQAIDLDFGMAVLQELEIDTDARTVTYLKDGTNQLQALALVGGPRKDWLKLVPGVNQLQYDETGMAAVQVDLEWEERHYA